MDRSIEWVHSSDLADPTPFLSSGDALLTTGTQFSADDEEAYNGYALRLRDAGVPALGFGTEVIRAGTPTRLVDACLRSGLVLFEVPYRTPFIAVARTVADIVADERYARDMWALSAQRAISRAALRPDGLSATLDELARQLGHWVALLDSRGEVDRVFPADALPGETLRELEVEARRLLHRGQRASTRVVSAGKTLTLQTLGGPGRLRGVLALDGSAKLDHAGREVITSVIALAGLALEQNHALDRARSHLRSGLLHALISGDIALVENTSREMWGPLPSEPLRVAALAIPGTRIEALTEALELHAEDDRGGVFYALHNAGVIVCVTEQNRSLIDHLCTTHGARGGVSDPVSYQLFGEGVAQATQALERALQGGHDVVEFAELARQGVLALLVGVDAREVARATLAPLIVHDTEHGTELLVSLRTWFECNAQFDAAARLLGIHRHTLRARIGHAEQLLQRNLAAFSARADVWAAMLAMQQAAAERK